MRSTPVESLNSSPENEQSVARKLDLGLQCADEFKPVALSLNPYQLTQDQWQQANDTAKALGQLFVQLAQQVTWLFEHTLALPEQSLAYQLSNSLKNVKQTASLININRHDLVLTKNGNWKLIESNSIAAGMGPFSETWANHLKERSDDASQWAENSAAQELASTLFDGAQRNRQQMAPTIIWLVEAEEDNVFDHQKMMQPLKLLGANLIVKTLNQLRNEAVIEHNQLLLKGVGRVDAIYWRTGYNLADYGQTPEEQALNMQFRASLEACEIALSPTINHQLATNKWIQMQLSQLTPAELQRLFQLSQSEADLAYQALAVDYLIPQSVAHIKEMLATGQWLLKQQGEGGGNTCQQISEASFVFQGAVLMKKIEPQVRPTPITKLTGNAMEQIETAVSELGLFSVGELQRYGGYLLRTKPKDTIESGVHRGQGVIDTVILTR